MKKQIASLIDHTFLSSSGDRNAVRRLCREAIARSFASVCVNPAEVRLAKKLLACSQVKVCTVVGFPLGQNTTAVKEFEAAEAIANGADELDFVLNIRLFKYDRAACEEELSRLAKVCRGPRRTLSKLIIECCELTDGEKTEACVLARKAGFDFVKTSTGFGRGGAVAADVRLMKKAVGPKMGVKAAGGIRTRADAMEMIAAGADRLGCSASCAITEKK